ncbi:MAG: hypothetical protein ACREXP_11615 [Steroidobacteraceae bacterium]
MSAAVSTIKCAVSHWSADQAATIGAALAFYCAFSQLTALFGKPTAEILLQAMRSSQTPDGAEFTACIGGVRDEHAPRVRKKR